MVVMVGMTFGLMFMMKRMPKQDMEEMQGTMGAAGQNMP
jgi:hypothetical protein